MPPTPDASAGAGYPRSTGSPRGEARRRDLLARVTDAVLVDGLTDFSLRSAARAAGTTHKVLLYHFGGADELLAQVVAQLRHRRIVGGPATAPSRGTLAERMVALWPALAGAEAEALDQAMGLAMTDPDRFGRLAFTALDDYLPPLVALCPDGWSERRKAEIAELVLATMRGLVLTRRTSPDGFDPTGALAALSRALDREEAALDTK